MDEKNIACFFNGLHPWVSTIWWGSRCKSRPGEFKSILSDVREAWRNKRRLNELHLIHLYWRVLKDSGFTFSTALNDLVQFFWKTANDNSWEKDRCSSMGFSCPSWPRGVQLQMKMAKRFFFLLYEIMSQHFFGATSKSSHECIYVLFFTWLQSPFFFQNTSPDGMQRNLAPHDRALTQPLFTWSHVMWSSGTRQNHSLCFTVPSRTAFNRRPHYATNKQEKEARSGLHHRPVPANSCHNGGMWPLLTGNALLMDRADLKGGFCLLSLSHDGPGLLPPQI